MPNKKKLDFDVKRYLVAEVLYPDHVVPLHVGDSAIPASWYHWRHLKISAGPGQRIPMEIPGYGRSLFQSTSGVKI